MIPFYVQPQLRQAVDAAPLALWGLERLNRGYQGAVLRVRRASDSALAACSSIADIATHCAGTNGFVETAYDQSGNSCDLFQPTAARQPKIYDAATGITKARGVAGLQFSDASQWWLSRGDNIGIPSGGNPAISTIIVTIDFASHAVPRAPCWIGRDSIGGAPDCWNIERFTTYLSVNNRIGGTNLTFAPDPASNTCRFVFGKAAGANMSACWARCNGAALAVLSSSSSNLVWPVTGGTAWGTALAGGGAAQPQQFCDMLSPMLAHYNADLTATQIAQAEAILRRMAPS